MQTHRATTFALLVTVAAGVPATMQSNINELTWISGNWCAEADGERIEEYWMPARGGVLLGVSRTTRDEKITAFEFLRIAVIDGVPTYLAQPQGNPPTPFRQTRGGSGWVVFENPKHDFPQRIEYRRTGDALEARIAGPGEAGRETIIPTDYRRCDAG